MDSAAAGSLELGRDAVKRHAWTEALEAFAAADREEGLSPDDLELMGEAAWWAGNPDEATDSLERAFAAYVEAGRPTEAAGVAFHLATWPSAARRRRSAQDGSDAPRDCSRTCPSRACTRGCICSLAWLP